MRMNVRPFFALACLLLVSTAAALLVACDRSGSTAWVAAVDDEKISLHQFNQKAAFMGLGADAKSLDAGLRKAVLDEMIQRLVILRQAAKLGVELSDQELDSEEERIHHGMDAAAFREGMLARGMDYQDWRDELARDLLVRKTIDLVLTPRISVDQSEIVAYYDEHKDQFSRPEQILALHLVLPDKKMADELVARMDRGQDMLAAAKEMGVALGSDGRPDWLGRGHMPGKLEKAVFAARPGRPAGPFHSDYGYHVVWVIEKRPAMVLPLAEAAGRIQDALAKEKKDALTVGWLEELKSESKIWVDPHFLKSGMGSNKR
ncbi:PpiC-type peptidyl-prolyl cis-trans isomerase [Desulfarculus baarsii DSM 2075]|uniref:PpiC-type peptidyl-prolyl cis-trans isomerase n=1 Tax=Desulfarculus baarsii (strain ATCC 33931 / DSM 2075 / LMG 7858 / VKM B-1802 / 2st14) TaxID=644282 RepID=E1QHF1_DESB2|nr:peptidyl-prolyl cis-trans isomerase [Desulfarculus baarsii]ADK84994.1 PpiC-type peptidyl-prolyl cis-trans isomerase [Desulfarculus baarsii DSM 2075]